jgi:hypothetical protein
LVLPFVTPLPGCHNKVLPLIKKLLLVELD